MQSRACSGFAEPQPTLAIVISITSAKVQKFSETTKHFERNFQNILATRHEVTLCLQRTFFKEKHTPLLRADNIQPQIQKIKKMAAPEGSGQMIHKEIGAQEDEGIHRWHLSDFPPFCSLSGLHSHARQMNNPCRVIISI